MSNYNINTIGAELEALKAAFNQLLANSKQPVEGTITETFDVNALIPIQNPGENVKFITRANFLDNLITDALGSLRRIDDDSEINEVTAVNQIAIGMKTGINGGLFFVGAVTFYPPTTDEHINFYYQLA